MMAFTMDFRIKDVASAKRKICTSWPASASASPCAKGNAALVGSSGPHALFIIIFNGFFGSGVFNARKGKPANCARNERRAICLFHLVTNVGDYIRHFVYVNHKTRTLIS